MKNNKDIGKNKVRKKIFSQVIYKIKGDSVYYISTRIGSEISDNLSRTAYYNIRFTEIPQSIRLSIESQIKNITFF